jgi:hypothetical protein
MKRRRPNQRFLLCVRNDGYPASLMIRRLYEQVPDDDAGAHGLVRVIDESDEDYLYPAKLFAELNVPSNIARAMSVAG